MPGSPPIATFGLASAPPSRPWRARAAGRSGAPRRGPPGQDVSDSSRERARLGPWRAWRGRSSTPSRCTAPPRCSGCPACTTWRSGRSPDARADGRAARAGRRLRRRRLGARHREARRRRRHDRARRRQRPRRLRGGRRGALAGAARGVGDPARRCAGAGRLRGVLHESRDQAGHVRARWPRPCSRRARPARSPRCWTPPSPTAMLHPRGPVYMDVPADVLGHDAVQLRIAAAPWFEPCPPTPTSTPPPPCSPAQRVVDLGGQRRASTPSRRSPCSPSTSARRW